jgi:hypothetical protein
MNVGRTPSSAPDPWSGRATALQAEANGASAAVQGNGFVKELRRQATRVNLP